MKSFIFTNLIPSLFVLSSFVFSFKQKKIPLKVFQLACIIPIPIFFFKCLKYIECSRCKLKDTEQANIDLKTRTQGRSNEEQVRNQLTDIDKNNHISDIDEDNQLSDTDEDNQISDIDEDSKFNIDASSGRDVGKAQSFETISDIWDKSNCLGSRHQVLETLLLHYKTLKLLGVKFTWLLIHKLYRIILVACNTYITNLLSRIYTMTIFLIFISVLNTMIRPYKSSTANATATMSYAANFCIALVSIAKTIILTFDCRTNCSEKEVFLSYLDRLEDILLVYIPGVVMCLFFAYKIIKTCMGKKKNE